MDKLKKLLEKQNALWLLIIGVVVILFGLYIFFKIKAKEDAGIEVRLPRLAERLYDLGGKYTLLALCEAVGIITLISGIKQVRDTFKN
ncbi:hypothetical protein AAG747_18550 [Rapidithrix thailandica]|uniref:Uncharacterized protein n=1 Tax=Rapidithrix thailandica TaxID=413964 RepID=A0AAW9S1E2_9BACT